MYKKIARSLKITESGISQDIIAENNPIMQNNHQWVLFISLFFMSWMDAETRITKTKKSRIEKTQSKY